MKNFTELKGRIKKASENLAKNLEDIDQNFEPPQSQQLYYNATIEKAKIDEYDFNISQTKAQVFLSNEKIDLENCCVASKLSLIPSKSVLINCVEPQKTEDIVRDVIARTLVNLAILDSYRKDLEQIDYKNDLKKKISIILDENEKDLKVLVNKGTNLSENECQEVKTMLSFMVLGDIENKINEQIEKYNNDCNSDLKQKTNISKRK